MKYKILIVVEDQSLIDEIQENAESCGFTVCWAKNNNDTFQRLKAEKIDLIVSSVSGSDIDGLKILEFIKKRDRLISTQIILLTNVLNKDELLIAKKFGVEGYYQVPLNMSEFSGKLKKLLCNEGMISKLKRAHAALEHDSKNLKTNNDNMLQRLRYERSKRHDQMVARQREMWKISVNIKGKKYSSAERAAEESKRFEKIQDQVEQDRDFIRSVDAKVQSLHQEFQDHRQKKSDSINVVQKKLNALTQ